MLRQILLTGVAAVAITAVATAARADNIKTNTWYTGHFTSSNTALLGGQGGSLIGTTGPILPNPTAQPTALPSPVVGGNLNDIVTLPNGGYLLVTDVESSGDRFEMFVNGVGATPAPAGATGLTPGGQQAIGSDTSVPTTGDNVNENITAALKDANFSSGTFYLPAGTDTITGTFLGGLGFGNMDLIVEAAVPEPAGLAVMIAGLAGLGLALRRRPA